MSFLQPLGLLGLLAVPIIILIYLLKSKYVEKPVSSTFIWKRSLKYVKTRVPLNLVVTLLLILQILVVIVGSFLIARPMLKPFSSKESIVILDTSASMLAKTEGDKTRFEVAKDKIAEIAEQAGKNSRITLITSGSTSDSLVMQTENKADIINALASVECSHTDTDPTENGAFEIANRIQELNSDAKIYFYTDKQFIDEKNIETIDCSADTDVNVSVIGIKDEKVAGNYMFTATVMNYGAESEDILVELCLDNTNKGQTRTTIEPGEQVEVMFTPPGIKGGDNDKNVVRISSVESYVQAKVVIKTSEDGLTLDNEYYLYSEEKEPMKVMIVSTDVVVKDGKTDFVETMTKFIFSAMTNIASNRYTINAETDVYKDVSQVKDFEGYDLYIFDGTMPAELPKDGAVWFINPPSNPTGTSITLGPITEGAGAFYIDKAFDNGSSAYSDITRGISTSNIAAKQYRAIDHSSKDATDIYDDILVINNEPVLVAGKVGSVRVCVLSLDLHYTTFPYIIEFPLLLDNMLEYSTSEALEKRGYSTGETAKFYLPVGSASLKFKYNGSVLEVIDGEDKLAKIQDFEYKLDKVGNYEIEIGFLDGTSRSYMMPTHIPEEEYDINAMGNIIEAPGVSPSAQPKVEPVEAWIYFAIALLILLVAEWGVYYRDEY